MNDAMSLDASQIILSDRGHAARFRLGLAGSTLIHLLVVALVLGLSSLDAPVRIERVLEVELVRWGDGGPAGSPPPSAPAEASEPAAPQPAERPAAAAPARPTPARPRTPGDALSDKLQALSRLRLPDATPDPQGGAGTAARRGSADGQAGAYGVADLIRAEVERRWFLDPAQIGPATRPVTLRLELNADGSVARVEAVDPADRALARSARNAVLVAAPFRLPAGLDAAQRRITLRLDPRASIR